MHNHDAGSEACLNRQILNNCVKRKATEDLCERPRKLIHRELRSQYLDTLTYKDIKNISRNMHKARPSQQILKNHMKHCVLYKCEQFRQNLLVNDLKKSTVMFSCKNNLQFLAPLMGFRFTAYSIQYRSFSTNYLQFLDSLCATCIFLTGQ